MISMLLLTMLVVAAIAAYAMGQSDRLSLHPRRRARHASRKGTDAMIEGIMRLFRDTTTPASAPELVAPTPTAASVRVSPDDPGIPADSRPRVATINALFDDVVRRLGEDVLGQPLLLEVEQMRDRHLPKLVASYAAVPPQHRREIFNRTGKSASVHLADSLDAMTARLREIDREISREHLDAFTDNSSFISRTYGRKEDPFS